MNAAELRRVAIDKIDEYVAGRLTEQAVSDWAQGIVVGDDWERLPPALTQAIHALFDLHDKGERWCPSNDELLRHKQALEQERSQD